MCIAAETVIPPFCRCEEEVECRGFTVDERNFVRLHEGQGDSGVEARFLGDYAQPALKKLAGPCLQREQRRHQHEAQEIEALGILSPSMFPQREDVATLGKHVNSLAAPTQIIKRASSASPQKHIRCTALQQRTIGDMAPKSKKRKMTAARATATTNPDLTKTIFMNLPAEIRCEVRGTLPGEKISGADEIVQIHQKQKDPREIVRSYHNRNPKHHGQVWDDGSRSWVPSLFTQSSILLVNRQVNMEATPVLVASDRLSLETTTALKDFLELIGESAQYLRYVYIVGGGYKTTTARAAFRALEAAKSLRALGIDHYNLCARYRLASLTTEKLTNDCKSLLKSLENSYEALKLSRNVLDVLSVSPRPYTHRSHLFRKVLQHERTHGDSRYHWPLCSWKLHITSTSLCFGSGTELSMTWRMTAFRKIGLRHVEFPFWTHSDRTAPPTITTARQRPQWQRLYRINYQLTRTGDNELRAWTDGCRLTSGDKLGRPAIYNATTKTYKQTLDVEASASYCIQSLQQYTITSGPLKGCKAIILVPAGSFRLLDLPREIRNMIYMLLVNCDGPTDLVPYTPNGGRGDNRRRVVQRSFKLRAKDSKHGWDDWTKKFDEPSTDSMSLLLVNRQTMEEVMEVLYGSNTFAFDSLKAIKLFEALCAHALHHIRSVELAFDSHPFMHRVQADLERAQQALWHATSLRKLQIRHNVVCRHNMDAETFVGMFTPLLKKLQAFKTIEGVNTT
ncbi:hypothetical protein DOTSEDRAFT_32275 [Dothistroma septosporum NZE10]|uniref:DUF7730 domain-containing protein n=1 Tax=Dothistroma septosporum (strain NZE10 / CBS 128990) TaxID=675120 RepID=N1Q0A7_DOTSN|nr:hypothetical protein DOTSEDRAFT_32275 [Dothistroma septosporum NZE10]